jgi:hypothetical protein
MIRFGHQRLQALPPDPPPRRVDFPRYNRADNGARVWPDISVRSDRSEPIIPVEKN